MLKQKLMTRNRIARVGCEEKDERVNHILKKCSKLVQKKYKTRHDWVGKIIHWELYKRMNFDNTAKWYMHKPGPVLANETQNSLGF